MTRRTRTSVALYQEKKKLPEATGPRGAEDSLLFRERLVGGTPRPARISLPRAISPIRLFAAVAGFHSSCVLRGPQRRAAARSNAGSSAWSLRIKSSSASTSENGNARRRGPSRNVLACRVTGGRIGHSRTRVKSGFGHLSICQWLVVGVDLDIAADGSAPQMHAPRVGLQQRPQTGPGLHPHPKLQTSNH